MSLELKDVKPGDLLCYGNNWYILIVQDQQGNNKNLKYVWISGNSKPQYFDTQGFRLGHKESYQGLEETLKKCVKITSFNIKNLIEELEKLKLNADRT